MDKVEIKQVMYQELCSLTVIRVERVSTTVALEQAMMEDVPVEEFIEVVPDHRELYDPSQKAFKETNLLTNVWQESIKAIDEESGKYHLISYMLLFVS